MSKDDFLRESMQRAARGEPPVGDAWSRFQRKRSRGNFLRGVAVSTVGLGAFIALILALPGLNANDAEPFAGSGPFEPSPATVKTYTDPIVGFEFEYPSDWIVDGTPGDDVVVHATGEYKTIAACESCAAEEIETIHRAYVVVDIEKSDASSKCALPKCGGPFMQDVTGAKDSRATVRVDGTDQSMFERIWPERAVAGERYMIGTKTYWCSGCRENVVWLTRSFLGGRTVTLALRMGDEASTADVVQVRQILDSFTSL